MQSSRGDQAGEGIAEVHDDLRLGRVQTLAVSGIAPGCPIRSARRATVSDSIRRHAARAAHTGDGSPVCVHIGRAIPRHSRKFLGDRADFGNDDVA